MTHLQFEADSNFRFQFPDRKSILRLCASRFAPSLSSPNLFDTERVTNVPVHKKKFLFFNLKKTKREDYYGVPWDTRQGEGPTVLSVQLYRSLSIINKIVSTVFLQKKKKRRNSVSGGLEKETKTDFIQKRQSDVRYNVTIGGQSIV